MDQSKTLNPTIVARKTLQQLAMLKIVPTPENYRRLYEQIAGNSNKVVHKSIAITAEQQSPSDSAVAASASKTTWATVVEGIVKQLQEKDGPLTAVKKRHGIRKVLTQYSNDPNQLLYKLEALIVSWGVLTEVQHSSQNSCENTSAELPNSNTEQNHTVDRYFTQLPDIFAQMLEQIVAVQINDVALMQEAKALGHQVREIQDQLGVDQFNASFQQFCGKFDVYNQSGTNLQQGLLRLLNRLMDSASELLTEDQWIRNQLTKLRNAISGHLDTQVIVQAEHYLEEITQRQDLLRHNLSEAEKTLKQMVTSLILNIDDLTNTTGVYQVNLESYSRKVSQTKDTGELNKLLAFIIDETKQMQKNTQSYHNNFLAARLEVGLAQSKINQLETELIKMGEKVHEDHLTGVLNRRGLDKAFVREASRVLRHETPLCFAILDIDNFKQLNDIYGHKVGDDALVYLVELVKDTTRPEDIVSRYGGEEFVILLPDTGLEEAFQILSRIRRNLTKKFFLNENKRLLITFSAGISQYLPGDTQESIFKRADKALYQAKRSGKNQILLAK